MNPIKVLVIVALGYVLTSSVSWAGIVFEVQPPSQSASVGSATNVDVQVSGLGNPPSLGTFDISISFDQTILAFATAQFGDPTLGDQLDPTGLGNIISFVNAGSGFVELFEVSLDNTSDLNSLQASKFVLFNLTFDTIEVGSSVLKLSLNAIGDADGQALAASGQDGSVIAVSVPEPSSFLVFGSLLSAVIVKMMASRMFLIFQPRIVKGGRCA